MGFEIKPVRTKKKGIDKGIVFRRFQDPELFDRLVGLCETAGASQTVGLRQCVRYALDNMDGAKQKDEKR